MTRQPQVRIQRQRWNGRSASATFVALVMLGSASCSASSPDPAQGARSAPSTSSAPATSPSTSSSPPSSEVGPSDSLGFDSSHQLTPAEAMVLYRQSLAQSAKDSDLKPVPKVAFVRFIEPSELATTQVTCMNDLGLPARATVRGNGFSIPESVPDSQKDFIKETIYRCAAMYPLHPQYNLPPSTVSLGRQYDWDVTKLLPCYRAQGLPVSDPPTKAVWVTSLAASSPDTWTPDRDLPPELANYSSKGRTELDQKCPPPGVDDLLEHPPVIKK